MSNNRKPTHRASVNLGTNERPFFTEIGAAWVHKDGKGLNLMLDLIPTKRQAIILRQIEAKPAAEDATETDQGSAQ